MALRPVIRERLRLIIVVSAFIPLALLAKAVASGKLQTLVHRGWAKAWERYDAVRDGSAAD